MGVADWRGGTTDICPGRQKPSRRQWDRTSHKGKNITSLADYSAAEKCVGLCRDAYSEHMLPGYNIVIILFACSSAGSPV